MIATKMAPVTYEMTVYTSALYYIVAMLLLAGGISLFGKAIVTWILNRLYDMMLGI